jgi:multidrug efflux system membrane fusion protein
MNENHSNETSTPAQSHAAPPSPKRRGLAWLLVFVVVLLLLLPMLHKSSAMMGIGMPGPPGGLSGPGAMVTTEPVRIGVMPITVDALGTVTPLQTVNVYAQVTGRVLSVDYREGQLVKKGDTLVEIDRKPTEAQLQQAQGSLERDQAALDQASINLKRYQDAFSEKALAEQTVFDQQATVRQSKGTVLNDLGSVDYYKTQLGYYHIVAPTSGRIGLRLVDPGNTVFSGSSTTIATITQITTITAVFSIAEDHLPDVMMHLAQHPEGLTVDLYDRSFTQKIASGKLTSVDNQIDTSTGTVKLRAQFDNGDGSLFPNQFVNARLQVDALQNAKIVSTAAIQFNGQQAFVYVTQADATIKL